MEQILVNAKTDLYAILGDPIKHSMSPVIMNRSFIRSGMDKIFLAMRCDPASVDCVMQALRVIDLKGYVVTMPLKELVPPHLDELRDEAAITGAVNCIQNEGGKLIGYNTDSMGFWTSVQEKNTAKRPIKKVFVMGMGGFAKAAVAQAALQGVTDIVATNNMQEEKFVKSFEAFLQRLQEKVPGAKVKMLDWNTDLWKPQLENADVVVNATPNGLGDVGDLHLQFPYEAVPQHTIFFDAIYSPLKTRYLQSAQERGHAIVAGLELLAHQGVCSFKIWTGKEVAPAVMLKDAMDFIG